MIDVKRHIGKIDRTSWKRLLENSKFCSLFQSPQCWELYSEMSFMKPFGVAVEEDGKLAGLIIGYLQKDGGALKSFFSRRAIVNGGPLLSDGISDEALSCLLREVRRMLQGKAIYVEIRNFEDYSVYKTVFEKCGFEYIEHLNFHIDTSSEELVESNLGKSRKRDIKISLREGATVVSQPSEDQVEDFYGLLSELYREKVKTPLFPYEFFDYLRDKDYAQLLLIDYQGSIIGGTVCVCQDRKAVYEWFACGKDGALKNIYPSTLATYAGIRYAAEAGYPRFDMMGAGSPDKSYGVRDFKAKFGGTLVGHGRFRHVFNPLLYGVGKLGVKIMKKL